MWVFYFMEKEIWKDVINFEGIYKVSNLGNVKRIFGTIGVNLKYKHNYNLKPLDNGFGYFRIKLSKNGVSKRYMLHRIIAEAFLLNPNKLRVVNHINENKKDNRLINLEWCTHSENSLKYNELNPIRKNTIKKSKGYVLDKRTGIFYSRIGVNGKNIHLGSFNTKEDAIQAYNKAYDEKIKLYKQKIKDV